MIEFHEKKNQTSYNLGPLTEMHQDIGDAIHKHTHTHTHTYIYICVCVCVYVCVCLCLCVSSKNTTAFSSICVDLWK